MQVYMESLEEQSQKHNLGNSDDVLPYIDRVCWRLSDVIRKEGGLGLHLDKRPGIDGLENIKKYRQCKVFSH